MNNQITVRCQVFGCGLPATIGLKTGKVICAVCATIYLGSHPITNPQGHVNGVKSEGRAMGKN